MIHVRRILCGVMAMLLLIGQLAVVGHHHGAGAVVLQQGATPGPDLVKIEPVRAHSCLLCALTPSVKSFAAPADASRIVAHAATAPADTTAPARPTAGLLSPQQRGPPVGACA